MFNNIQIIQITTGLADSSTQPVLEKVAAMRAKIPCPQTLNVKFKKMKFKSAIYITNSIIIFMISCCLPAVSFKIGSKSFSYISPVEVKWGWEFLFFGPFGIFLGVKSSICWAANIFYLISIIYLINDNFKLSLNFAIISLFVGVSFPLLSYYFPLLQDEGGVMHARFYKPQIGYFLWILSIAIVGATAYFEKCNQSKIKE